MPVCVCKCLADTAELLSGVTWGASCLTRSVTAIKHVVNQRNLLARMGNLLTFAPKLSSETTECSVWVQFANYVSKRAKLRGCVWAI